MDETAGSVLDASILLAYLQGESGSEPVQAALTVGAVINVVNYAEVLLRLGDAGEEPAVCGRRLQEQGLVDDLLEVVSLTDDDAVAIARLRATIRAQGLSLSNRARLATGLRLSRPVLAADRSWAAISVGVTVRSSPGHSYSGITHTLGQRTPPSPVDAAARRHRRRWSARQQVRKPAGQRRRA